MAYWVKAPWWLKLFYKNLVWQMPFTSEKAVYLTFDDGPHETITPFVLDQLEKYNAKATFFCIGKNVQNHTDIYTRIVNAGHTVGNHTNNHLNGWKTNTQTYLDNIEQAATYIKSKLYRPPYGRITKEQASILTQKYGYNIYMWNILSGDFDVTISPQKCLDNVLKSMKPNTIIVFHDSEKAWDRLSYVLPKVLELCNKNNWQLKALPQQ